MVPSGALDPPGAETVAIIFAVLVPSAGKLVRLAAREILSI